MSRGILYGFFEKFVEVITKLTWVLVTLLMAAIIVDISADVFFRYVLLAPLGWASQVAKYLMVWFAFLGSSLALGKGAHVHIDLVVKNLSLRWKKSLFCASYLGIAFFLSTVIIFGSKFAYGIRFDKDPLVGIPTIYPFLAIPVGSSFMLIQLLWVLVTIVKQK